MGTFDEYDRGEPFRDRRRFSVRWKAEGRNVMTDDGPDEKALHIATFTSPAVAEHVTELHNRTLGDGQDPPLSLSGLTNLGLCVPGCDYPITSYHARRAGRVLCGADPAKPERRGPTSRTLVRLDVRQRVMEMVESLVQERVTAYAAREPARLVIDGDPVAMANVLSKLGYTVFAPDHVFEGAPTAGVPVDTETLISILERRGYQVAQKVSPE